MNYYRSVICVYLFISLQIHSAFACRYNIRETGFVDLGSGYYNFYGYIDNNTPEEIVVTFREIPSSAFIDCNIRFELINTDIQKDHPAMQYLSEKKIKTYPAAILASPDERSVVIDLYHPGKSFRQSLESAINDIIYSPVRKEIIKEVMETYGVILLIDSKNKLKNEKYSRIARDAIKNIKNQMKTMVKRIERPPVLVHLNPELFPRERILLWSLGMDSDILPPYAAVFYGRGRWIGPLMKAEEISTMNLVNILSVIGLDCECDLDKSWVRGTMLPMKWDQKIQTQVAELLEFDPENPMVKFEVDRIMKMGSYSYPGVPASSPRFNSKSALENDGYIVDEEKSSLESMVYFIPAFITMILLISVVLIIKLRNRTQ